MRPAGGGAGVPPPADAGHASVLGAHDSPIDYGLLLARRSPTADTWDAWVREVLLDLWCDAYRERTAWEPSLTEIALVSLTYIFDAGPTRNRDQLGDDRVVAVWGSSHAAAAPRDGARQHGFIRDSSSWSRVGRDRGHFVAHAAGGGMDMNFFPQAAGLNRGTTQQGKTWKAMEAYVIRHPGAHLFVRPTYLDSTWCPTKIDYGILVGGRLWQESFDNTD